MWFRLHDSNQSRKHINLTQGLLSTQGLKLKKTEGFPENLVSGKSDMPNVMLDKVVPVTQA